MEKDKKEKSSLLFKDFQLEQIAFEIRFSTENYYQQVFKSFWKHIQSQISSDSGRIRYEEPTVITYDNKFEIRVSSDTFAVMQFFPDSSLKELLKVSKIFYDAIIEILGIEAITRVGLRPIYTKDYDDDISVAEILYQTPYINYPDNLYLSQNSLPLIPALIIGWEDEERGITYRLKGKSGKLGIDLPLELIASGKFQKTIEKVYNQVILDIDMYIHKPITPGQFILDEWINQAYETVKKEGSKFFGES